jgi:DNA helicase-4
LLLNNATTAQRWMTSEAVKALLAVRPAGGLLARLGASGLSEMLNSAERDAAAFLDADFKQLVEQTNTRIVDAELVTRRAFFDSIERSPLTDEQATAVICCDNRVQVVAAAGSGKTSVMVARAAYGIHRGFTTPDRILLLAFKQGSGGGTPRAHRDSPASCGN